LPLRAGFSRKAHRQDGQVVEGKAIEERAHAGEDTDARDLQRLMVLREVFCRDQRRVRDETDWPTVALALATDSAILTSDPGFLGGGIIALWSSC